jgi:hypothetical protein
MTGPDLSGYQTTAAASSTYLPLAGGTTTGAITFNIGSSIAAKIGVTGLFSIGGEAGSADSLLTVTNGGAVGLEFSPIAISDRNRILSYNRAATAFVPLNYAASEHNWDVSGTVHLSLTSAGLTLNAGTANGLAYLNAGKVLTTGTKLTFDDTNNRLGVVGTGYSPNIALSDAATIAWDTAAGQVATFTFVSSNRTVGAPSSLVSGAFYALAVIQNAGSNTLTWNSVFKWANGAAPTLSTAASAKDYFVFRSDGTNLYEQGRSQGVV